jgi:hypothetical protein
MLTTSAAFQGRPKAQKQQADQKQQSRPGSKTEGIPQPRAPADAKP